MEIHGKVMEFFFFFNLSGYPVGPEHLRVSLV